jgi:hypothetical protein
MTREYVCVCDTERGGRVGTGLRGGGGDGGEIEREGEGENDRDNEGELRETARQTDIQTERETHAKIFVPGPESRACGV